MAGYGLNDQGSITRRFWRFLIISTASRLVLGSSQSPVQYVPGMLRVLWRVTLITLLHVRGWQCVELYLGSPIRVRGEVCSSALRPLYHRYSYLMNLQAFCFIEGRANGTVSKYEYVFYYLAFWHWYDSCSLLFYLCMTWQVKMANFVTVLKGFRSHSLQLSGRKSKMFNTASTITIGHDP